jgi:hypothetical protein
MDSEFRPLDTRERGLLERLLGVPFPGRDELRAQLRSVSAQQVEQDGTLLLRCSASLPAPTKYRVAIEGVCTDADGATIGVLLHIDAEGRMSMLEVIKYDGSPIIKAPSGAELVPLLPE